MEIISESTNYHALFCKTVGGASDPPLLLVLCENSGCIFVIIVYNKNVIVMH